MTGDQWSGLLGSVAGMLFILAVLYLMLRAMR